MKMGRAPQDPYVLSGKDESHQENVGVYWYIPSWLATNANVTLLKKDSTFFLIPGIMQISYAGPMLQIPLQAQRWANCVLVALLYPETVGVQQPCISSCCMPLLSHCIAGH